MRFLVDMNLDVRVAEWLRQQGHDARHLREEGLQRLPNGRIFSKAEAENRVVVTLDLDFGEIAASAKGKKPSVLLLRLRDSRAPHVIERLAAVIPPTVPVLEGGAVVLVEDFRYRVRLLPIGGEA